MMKSDLQRKPIFIIIVAIFFFNIIIIIKLSLFLRKCRLSNSEGTFAWGLISFAIGQV